MNVTLFMAMSVNGMIADQEGGESFLSHEHWLQFCALAKEFGNIIIGRNTYQAVKQWGEAYSFDDLQGIDKVVVSRNVDFELDDGYLLAHSPHHALEILQQKYFHKALLVGGAALNASFAKASLLHEVRINIEPAVIGKGVPLFAAAGFEFDLKLVEIKQHMKGIITLRYVVLS